MAYNSSCTGAEFDSALSILNNMWVSLIVQGANANSTVTLTLNEHTLSKTTDNLGNCIFDIPEYGLWTITANVSSSIISETINICEVKQYTFSFL